MNSQSTSQFISALVKNLQAVCHGNVEFDQNVKIVGHLFLTVDSATEFNYIVNEKVSKSDESSTTFISKSFYATDPHQKTPKKNCNRAFLQTIPDILGKPGVVNSDTSGDRQLPKNRFSTSSSFHNSLTQSPQNLSQSKKRISNSRNSSPKVPKLSPHKDTIEIDLDSDLLVSFGPPETESKTQSEEESDNRVPPVHQPSDENIQKYDDYEVFHNVGFDSEEQVKDEKNLSISPLQTPSSSKSTSNLPFSTEISGHVDLSRVKQEAKENSEGDEDLQNNSVFSQDEGDNSNMIKQEQDSTEFFNTLREQTLGLNTGTESNYDLPHIPGMSGAGYQSVPSTSSDYSKNAGVDGEKSMISIEKFHSLGIMSEQSNLALPSTYIKQKLYQCDICSIQFFNKASLDIHSCDFNLCKEKIQLTKNICSLPKRRLKGTTTAVKPKAKRGTFVDFFHAKSSGNSQKMKYTCEICQNVFFYEQSLKNHNCNK